jgi:hypothetical protein
MDCKDSDVFALEASVEKVLNNGDWKNVKEIEKELSKSNEDSYMKWVKKRKDSFINEYSEELFYKDIMDRMCSLFPMKYTKNDEIDPKKTKYGRTSNFNS